MNRNASQDQQRDHRPRLAFWPAVLLLLLSGCGSDEILVDYGHRTGISGTESVNGTAVLGEMFAKAGHVVESKRALTPSLDQAQTIVWFPDSYHTPSDDVSQWLDRWLGAESGRTVIYVGRGYNAELLYWQKAIRQASASQKSEYAVRQAAAEARVRTERGKLPDQEEGEWFDLLKMDPPLEPTILQGPWAATVDGAKTEIQLSQEIVPPQWFEWLLEAENRPIVSREVIRASGQWRQRVLVANGSFLLNFALVNHEHRKLAGQLIELAGPPGRVVFLESEEHGPPILNSDPTPELPQTLALFGVWPLNVVLLHFAVLGIIFGFARWPIFGNPQAGEAVRLSNFSDHAVALGKLLQRAGQRDFAVRRLAEYRNLKP